MSYISLFMPNALKDHLSLYLTRCNVDIRALRGPLRTARFEPHRTPRCGAAYFFCIRCGAVQLRFKILRCGAAAVEDTAVRCSCSLRCCGAIQLLFNMFSKYGLLVQANQKFG